MRKLSFVATDKKHDCHRCYYENKMYNCEREGKSICDRMAEDMEVFSTYAILESSPEIEYIGG